MSSTERTQKKRGKDTNDQIQIEREAAKMRMRKLRGKNVDNITNDNMDMSAPVEVQVHSGPGEVEPGQEGGLKLKRFDVLVSTMISNYCAGVTSRLQAAHHQ